MSWFCESGCVEQRPGDMIFDTSDFDLLRQSQGVPMSYVSGFRTVACSVCSNLFEVWIKAQPFWDELADIKIREVSLKGELTRSGGRDVADIQTDMKREDEADKAWGAKAFPLIKAWWDERREKITAESKAQHAENRAKKDAERAERDKTRAEKK